MKNKCLLLLRVQLRSQLRWNRKSKSSAVIMVSAALITMVLIVYSFGIGYGLGYMGLGSLIPSLAIAATGLITIGFTVLKTNGVLFGYKDYDMLMSLPVKTGTIIASRFLGMYIMNLIFTALVMVSMGTAYVIFERPQPYFYLVWLIGILASPLIPTTIAALLGWIVMAISARLKHANIISIVLSFGAFIALMAGLFSFGGMAGSSVNINQLTSIGIVLSDSINRIYPLSAMFKAAAEGSYLALAAFLIVSFGWYLIFVKLISFRYKAINTGLTTFHTRSDYHLTEQKMGSPLMALYKKELKRFLTCMIYVVNVGVCALLAVLMSAACMVAGQDTIVQVLNIPRLGEKIIPIIPFLIATFLSMCSTTSSSLSLEGKNLWIIKSLPVAPKTVFQSKILVNLTLLLPASLLSSLFLLIAFRPNFITAVFYVVTPMVFSCMSSVWGMFVNIKLPNYEWVSETAVVKQSMATLASMMGGLITGVLSVFALILAPPSLVVFLMAGITALAALAALFLYTVICRSKF